MNGTVFNRKEYELYLRNMTCEVINDTTVVKNIVDEVFEKINIKNLHDTSTTKEQVKMELISFTRKKILNYLKHNTTSKNKSDIAMGTEFCELAGKYSLCCGYFSMKVSKQIKLKKDGNKLVNEQLEQLNSTEKDILIRKYYYLQSSEKIAMALDYSIYKINKIEDSILNKIWNKIILNKSIYDKNDFDLSTSTNGINKFYSEKVVNNNKKKGKKDSKTKGEIRENNNLKINKLTKKDIQEYFIINMLQEASISEIELVFDDICLESMGRLKPDKKEAENLEYLSIYRTQPQMSMRSKVKKRKLRTKKAISFVTLSVCLLVMILVFGGGQVLTKAGTTNDKYRVSSTKLGLNFTYHNINNSIQVNIEELFYVNDRSEVDYTETLDKEMAKRVDKNNMYARNNVEQTVYEKAPKYLNSKNEGEFKYVKGDRKYVCSKKYNILFVAEYTGNAWECAKVIYVDKIEANSKYHLDSKNTLQGFYKDASIDKWKCELYTEDAENSNNSFKEIVFEDDNSKMTTLGTYSSGNISYNRIYNKNTGIIEMIPTTNISKERFGENFITYFEKEGYVFIYYNYYNNGSLETTFVGKLSDTILERCGRYIRDNKEKMLSDIEEYGICLPNTDTYILPYVTLTTSNDAYNNDYKEFNYYSDRELLNQDNILLGIYTNEKGDNKYTKIYKLHDKSFYKKMAVLTTYKQIKSVKNYLVYTVNEEKYTCRVFNNKFIEILDYSGNEEIVEIPNYIDGYEVKYIGNSAFEDNNVVAEIIIPASVVEIGKSSFAGCEKLQRVVIEGSVVSLGEKAYEGCTKLETIKMDDTLKYIGANCFKGTKLLTELPKSRNVVYFKGIALEYTGKNSNILISTNAIGVADGFLGEKARQVTSITIPENVKYIGNNAFEQSRIRKIELPSNLQYLGSGAFKDCMNLLEIEIPATINEIYEKAFMNCISLNKVIINEGTKIIREEAFVNINDNATIYIPQTTNCIFVDAIDEKVETIIK